MADAEGIACTSDDSARLTLELRDQLELYAVAEAPCAVRFFEDLRLLFCPTRVRRPLLLTVMDDGLVPAPPLPLPDPRLRVLGAEHLGVHQLLVVATPTQLLVFRPVLAGDTLQGWEYWWPMPLAAALGGDLLWCPRQGVLLCGDDSGEVLVVSPTLPLQREVGWRVAHRVRVHFAAVAALTPLAPDMVAVAAADGSIAQLALADPPRVTARHFVQKAAARFLVHFPDLRMLVCGGSDRAVYVLPYTCARRPVVTLTDPFQPHVDHLVGICRIDATPFFVSCDRSGLAKVWDVCALACVKTVQVPPSALHHPKECRLFSFVYFPGPRQLVFNGPQTYVYQLRLGDASADAGDAAVVAVLYHPSPPSACVVKQTHCLVWDLRDASLAHRWDRPTRQEVTAAALYACGRRLLVGDSAGTVHGLALPGGQRYALTHSQAGAVLVLHHCPAARLLLSGHESGAVAVWRGVLPERPASRPHLAQTLLVARPATALALSPAGLLLVGDSVGTVHRFACPAPPCGPFSAAPELGCCGAEVLQLYDLRDGRLLLSVDASGHMQLWDSLAPGPPVASWQEPRKARPSPAAVTASVWLPPAGLATGNDQGEVDLWAFSEVLSQPDQQSPSTKPNSSTRVENFGDDPFLCSFQALAVPVVCLAGLGPSHLLAWGCDGYGCVWDVMAAPPVCTVRLGWFAHPPPGRPPEGEGAEGEAEEIVLREPSVLFRQPATAAEELAGTFPLPSELLQAAAMAWDRRLSRTHHPPHHPSLHYGPGPILDEVPPGSLNSGDTAEPFLEDFNCSPPDSLESPTRAGAPVLHRRLLNRLVCAANPAPVPSPGPPSALP
eukprot:EG_transcript_2991